MDEELSSLESRRAADPSDPRLTERLAGEYLRLGRSVDAYILLFEHPAFSTRHPLLRHFGAVLARQQSPILDRIAEGQPGVSEGRRFFATHRSPTGHWDWRPRWELRKLPVLAVNLATSAWTPERMALAGSLPALLALNLRNTAVVDADLAPLAAIKTLREVDLSMCRRLSWEGLRPLEGLPRLERVRLAATEIDRGMLAERLPKTAALAEA